MGEETGGAGEAPGDGEGSGPRRRRALVDALGDGVAQFDPGGEVTAVNEAMTGLTGYPRERLLGRHVSTLVDEADDLQRAIRDLLAGEAEALTVDATVRTADGDAVACELRVTPVWDDEYRGAVAAFREVEDRDDDPGTAPPTGSDAADRGGVGERLERHTRALQRLYDVSADHDRSFGERVRRVLALGREYLDTSDAYLAEIDPEADRFEVVHASGDDERYAPGATAPLSETYCRRTVDSGRPVATAAAGEDDRWADDPAYESWGLECYLGSDVVVEGEPFGTLCFVDADPRSAPFSDEERTFVELATQWVGYELGRQRQRERLERYREFTDAKLDALDDLFYTLDDEGRLQWWNDAVEAVTGYSAADLEDKPGLDLFGNADRERVAETIAAAFETGSGRVEADLVTADGDALPYEFTASALDDPDGNRVLAGIGRDVSERKEREAALEQYRALTEAANDVIVTIDGHSVIRSINPAVADVFGYDPEELVGDSLTRLMPEDLAPEHRRAVERYLETGERTVDWDYLELPGERADGTHVPLAVSFAEVEHGGGRYFTGIVREITERKEREAALERRRERLAALNQLNEVVRGVTDAAIEQSTREEIEAIVCERLAASSSFEFAWIGDADADEGRVVPRARAGPNVEAYLDEIEISLDPEDPQSRGPTGRAYLTGEVQTARDVLSDDAYEPWREIAREYGFRSSAAVPIVHEGTTFGVLNVYADRPAAFADEERATIAHLGEILGHAIAAVERKRALMSDEVVELELRVRDVFEAVGAPSTEGEIVFDRVVPLGDDGYRTYGTATADARPTIEALADAFDHWRSIEIEDAGETVRFEATTTESPLVGTVASHGGVVEHARVEGGDLYVTAHLPRGADVRAVIEAVEAEYDGVEPLARRQVSRADDSGRRARLALLEELTDRQRTALETAYYGGFFEWPRDASGEELADRLEIAPATFSQHLRAAQRKLLAAVFEEVPASG